MSDSPTQSVVALPGRIHLERIRVWVASSPNRIFWSFALTHLFLWTIVCSAASPNAPLDVIEGYVWGHEWIIGNHKHPPMQGWILGFLAWATGRAPWVHYFASQVAIVTSFWAVWQTGRRMFSEQAALLGALILEGVVYYNFLSWEFNPNLLQLPFWALTGLFFHRAVTDDRLTDWLLLGVFGAAGLYSKYSSLLLLITLAFLLLVRPEGRRRLKAVGPYIAAGTAFLLFLPHIVWLFGNDFLPFTYAWDRMQAGDNSGLITSSVRAPLFYVISQVLALLPAILLFTGFFDHGTLPRDMRFRPFERDYLDFVTFGPFVITLAMSVFIGMKIHDMWAMPFWNFIGLWAIARFRAIYSPRALRRFAVGWATVCLATLMIYYGGNTLWPYVTHQGQRINFPGQALAHRVDDAWHQRYTGPLNYVIGDIWPAGNVAYYAEEWPHVLIKGNYAISPWIDPADLRRQGAILVWCLENCAYKNRSEADPNYMRLFPEAIPQEPIILPKQTDADVPPVKIGWAILAPAPGSRVGAESLPNSDRP